MDESEQGAHAAEDRSHKTAEALRALREGLGAKLETHRRRITDLETDLTSRVLQIAEELAQEQATESRAEFALHEDQLRRLRDQLTERDAKIAKLERQVSDSELHQLRLSAELAESRSAIETVRLEECPDCERLRAEIAAQHDRLSKVESAELELSSHLASTLQELTETRQHLQMAEEREHRVHVQLREEQAAKQKETSKSSSQISELQTTIDQLTQQVDDLTQLLADARNNEAELLSQHSADDSTAAELRDATKRIKQDLDNKAFELVEAEERELAANLRIEELLANLEGLEKQLAEAQALESQLQQKCSTSEHDFAETQASLEESKQSIEQKTLEVEQLTEQLSLANESVARLEAQCQAENQALTNSRAEIDLELQGRDEKINSLASERETLASQVEELRGELNTLKESTASELSWIEKECEAAELAKQQLASEFEELLKQQKATEDSLSAANEKNDQAVSLLKKAEARILELSNSAVSEEALEQAQRKFELALADTQKLKRENAELQEELAQRPEKSDSESPELVSLRVERDALATRVAELEAIKAPAVDPDVELRLSDAQRRFELAVEDLRQLKQENVKLQEQLVKGGGSVPVHPTAMDWQSQKARLLAALESEEEAEQTVERQQERTTITGTIEITDRVVAEKDREIYELQRQLAEQSIADKPANTSQDVLDGDEFIATERAKIAELQKELHEKLRTAELELSVQRAALARKEAEIEQKQQAAIQAAADAPVGPDGKPRRKWLSALGLRDDDEKK